MSGYRSDFSRSNRAYEAAQNGLHPASVLAKRHRVPTAFVRDVLRPSEWHHTSVRYNRTDFYDGDALAELLATPDGQAALAAFKTRAKTADETVHRNCVVRYLEWSGSVRHPKATECEVHRATVRVRGQTAYISAPGGFTLTKRLSTNGFSFLTPADRAAARKAEQAAQRHRVEVRARFRAFLGALRRAVAGARWEKAHAIDGRPTGQWGAISVKDMLALAAKDGQFCNRDQIFLDLASRGGFAIGPHRFRRRERGS